MIALDEDWIANHLLPLPGAHTDKNKRGRVLAVGGSASVPAALLLTGEAALRAGAGKVQLATVAPAALPLGICVPEAAVHALDIDADGELAGTSAAAVLRLSSQADALILGPGTGSKVDATAMLRTLLRAERNSPIVVDAGMLPAVPKLRDEMRQYSGSWVLTPHPGEMATLMNCAAEDMCCELAEAAARRFSATIVLKSSETWIATPGHTTLHYSKGHSGLATGGSGDVLAGILGGLLARGIAAHEAAGWAVWAHGEAGIELARQIGPLGYLAREILPLIPRVLRYS